MEDIDVASVGEKIIKESITMHELLHFYEFNICDTNSLSWITKNLFTLDPDRQMGWEKCHCGCAEFVK